jgi:hypothetical protein
MTSFWILLICNLSMVALSMRLLIKMDVRSARMVMFGSYFYLMVVLLSLYANRKGSADTEASIQPSVKAWIMNEKLIC